MKLVNGYIALTSTLVLVSVGLLIVLSLYFVNINEVQTQLVTREGVQVETMGEACIEDMISRLRDNGSFSGGTYIFGTYTCETVVSPSGLQRTLDVDVYDVKNRYSYQVVINLVDRTSFNDIEIVSWELVE